MGILNVFKTFTAATFAAILVISLIDAKPPAIKFLPPKKQVFAFDIPIEPKNYARLCRETNYHACPYMRSWKRSFYVRQMMVTFMELMGTLGTEEHTWQH